MLPALVMTHTRRGDRPVETGAALNLMERKAKGAIRNLITLYRQCAESGRVELSKKRDATLLLAIAIETQLTTPGHLDAQFREQIEQYLGTSGKFNIASAFDAFYSVLRTEFESEMKKVKYDWGSVSYKALMEGKIDIDALSRQITRLSNTYCLYTK